MLAAFSEKLIVCKNNCMQVSKKTGCFNSLLKYTEWRDRNFGMIGMTGSETICYRFNRKFKVTKTMGSLQCPDIHECSNKNMNKYYKKVNDIRTVHWEFYQHLLLTDAELVRKFMRKQIFLMFTRLQHDRHSSSLLHSFWMFFLRTLFWEYPCWTFLEYPYPPYR